MRAQRLKGPSGQLSLFPPQPRKHEPHWAPHQRQGCRDWEPRIQWREARLFKTMLFPQAPALNLLTHHGDTGDWGQRGDKTPNRHLQQVSKGPLAVTPMMLETYSESRASLIRAGKQSSWRDEVKAEPLSLSLSSSHCLCADACCRSQTNKCPSTPPLPYDKSAKPPVRRAATFTIVCIP